MSGRRDLEVSPADAKALLDAGRAVLVDVRTKEEWDLVHVPGSVHVPLDRLEEDAADIEVGDGQRVLVLCHHGHRSLRAALALRAMGLTALSGAVSVHGGLELWSRAADAGVPRYERGPGVLRLIAPGQG